MWIGIINPSRAWIKQKGEQKENSFSVWAETSYSPALDHWLLDSYQDLDHWPPILRPLNLNWMTRLTFLVLYLADGRLWDFSTFKTMWVNSCKSLCLSTPPLSFYLYLSLYISPVGLFLWRTLTNIQVLLEKCTVMNTVIAGLIGMSYIFYKKSGIKLIVGQNVQGDPTSPS